MECETIRLAILGALRLVYVAIAADNFVDHLYYLKLSYFSGTLNLAILCRQGFSVFLF